MHVTEDLSKSVREQRAHLAKYKGYNYDQQQLVYYVSLGPFTYYVINEYFYKTNFQNF